MRRILLLSFALALSSLFCRPPALPQERQKPLVTRTITSPVSTPTFTSTIPSPTSTPTAPLTPTLQGRQVCQEAPPSPFKTGMEGRVCNPDRILMRSKPSPRARVIGSIVPGMKFTVIDGPECGDKRVWWKVRLHFNGLTGWMPETAPEGEEVYLCPLP